MLTRDVASALSVLATGEVLLARATSGPLPVTDVVAAAAGWGVVLGLAARWPRPALWLATAAVGAHVLLAPAHGAAGPVGAFVAAAFGLGVLGMAREAPPVRLAIGALLVTTGLAALSGPSPGHTALLPAALGLGAAVLAARWHPALVVPVALSTVLPFPRLPRDDPRPDVLLVTVDALRADTAEDLSAFTDVAARGRTYEAWAPSPWTLPSLASLHTGVPPHVHGAGRATGDAFTGPDPALPTLAEVLTAEGYRTSAIGGGNPFTGHRYGLLSGFDEVWHPWEPVAVPLPRARAPHAPARPLFARLLRLPSPAADAEVLVDRALARLQARDGPRLVWLHLMDVHLPHADPPCRPEILGQGGTRPALLADPWWSTHDGRDCLASSHRAAAARVDAALQRLLASVDPARTVIVLTADHGEALGDAGLEHGHVLQPEVLRVPLVIAAPVATLPAVHGPVSLTDVGATVLSLVGAPAVLPGLDLTRHGTAGPTPLTAVLYGPPRRGVVDGDWLLVETGGDEALYAWRRPLPQREVDAAAVPEVASRLRRWLPEGAARREGVMAERGALEALGYVDPPAPAAPHR